MRLSLGIGLCVLAGRTSRAVHFGISWASQRTAVAFRATFRTPFRMASLNACLDQLLAFCHDNLTGDFAKNRHKLLG